LAAMGDDKANRLVAAALNNAILKILTRNAPFVF